MASTSSGKSQSVSTRRITAVWLIGQTDSSLPFNVLPTLGHVMKMVFYNHKVLKKTITESIKVTVNDLLGIWSNARIPVALKQNIISKTRISVDEYMLIYISVY